jgi:preprotein translocase subunit SecA
MRIFGSERIQGLMGRLGMEEGEPIEHKMVSKAIERAQGQVEGRNFETRKHLLEYDDVMNKQREAIYELRKDILEGKEGKDYLLRNSSEILGYYLDAHCPEKSDPRDWDFTQIRTDTLAYFDIDVNEMGIELEELGVAEIEEALLGAVKAKYEDKEERLGSELMRALERDIMLRVVDGAWKDHLLALDHLKEGISLRGYGQRDPKQEYKRESFELFQAMKERIEDTIVKGLFRVEPVSEEQMAEERRRRQAPPAGFQFSAPPKTGGPPTRPQTMVRKTEKVGRNDPCPCGSGKKYKKCCGAPASVAS